MTIRYQCSCGAKIAAPPAAAGRRVRCRVCGAVSRVPAGAAASSPPAPPTKIANDKSTARRPETQTGGWLEEFAQSESKPPPNRPALLDLAEPEPEPASDPPVKPVSQDSGPSRWADDGRDGISGPDKSFWRDLAESFIFFLDAGNLATLIGITLMATLPGLIPVPFVGLVLGLLATCYIWAFLLSITLETASGQDELPSVWIDSLWDDLIRPLFLFLGTWFWVLFPAIVVAMIGRATSGAVPWHLVTPLGAVGLFFWPVVMLGVAIGGSFQGLWPHVMVRTVLAAPGPYLAVCGAILVAGSFQYVAGSDTVQALVSNIGAGPVIALAFLSQALSLYASIVAMRVIGLYYRHYKQRFPWQAE